jgi:predicted PurR-regulated permease PerM
MIFSYLEKLRRKPVEVRRTYTLVITIVITSVVVLIWLLFAYINSFGTRPTEGERVNDESSQTLTDLFEQSNEFLDNVNENTYIEDSNDWTQQLQQFHDDSLFIESQPAATSSLLDDVLTSTSSQI